MSEPEVEARDLFLRSVYATVPEATREGPEGAALRARMEALADAVLDAERRFREERVYRDDDVRRINEAVAQVRALDERFSLADVDAHTGEAVQAFSRDAESALARLVGRLEHEGEWDGERWTTWNFEYACVPQRHVAPEPPAHGEPYAPVQEIVRGASALRVVAAGHTFNESTCTGGTRDAPDGTLLSLDRYDRWERVPAEEAARCFGVTGEDAGRVVRVQAGKRLRDVGSALWGAGLALPIAGSTDAQSLGGLIATDVHGTGRDHGFLSEQLLELRLVTAEGALVTFTRTGDGWATDESPARSFRFLPVAGALGMLGVVVEVTLQAERAFHLRRASRFVSRAEAEADLPALLGEHDHLSLYYAAGGPGPASVRLNTWDRTPETPSWSASFSLLAHELGDHALMCLAPGLMIDYAQRDPRSDPLLRLLNEDAPLVLPAPAAFARRLYYQHDELEYGIPVGEVRACARALTDLLTQEQFQTIVEIRFTPDRSPALLGPGTAGRGRGGTAYLELATPFGLHSRLRIAEVHERVHALLVAFGGRPHLGKKTAIDATGMAAIYGEDWEAFQALRRAWDPGGKLLPKGNRFLGRLFGGGAPSPG
jgi:FAD/FMN-containing dehydrogenase